MEFLKGEAPQQNSGFINIIIWSNIEFLNLSAYKNGSTSAWSISANKDQVPKILN